MRSLLFLIFFTANALLFAESSLSSGSETNPVPFPAPNVSWQELHGSVKHLASLQGKPVLLLIAPSPKSGAFRRQLKELKPLYQRLAAQNLICIAAFTKEDGRITSNIPFLKALDGPKVAHLYDINRGFALALISKNGNLDCLSTRVLAGQRIYDLIDASYATQEALRRE